jgi:hypothetical protein
MKAMKITTVAASLLLATAIPASAGHYGGGGANWGAAIGGGVLGGLIGAALAPQPQTIIVTPTPPPLPQIFLWCPTLAKWYGEVAACPMEWRPVQMR